MGQKKNVSKKDEIVNPLAWLLAYAESKAYTPYPLEKVYGPQKKPA